MADEKVLTEARTSTASQSVGGLREGLGSSGNVYTGGVPSGSGTIQSGGDTYVQRDPLNAPGSYQKVGDSNAIYDIEVSQEAPKNPVEEAEAKKLVFISGQGSDKTGVYVQTQSGELLETRPEFSAAVIDIKNQISTQGADINDYDIKVVTSPKTTEITATPKNSKNVDNSNILQQAAIRNITSPEQSGGNVDISIKAAKYQAENYIGSKEYESELQAEKLSRNPIFSATAATLNAPDVISTAFGASIVGADVKKEIVNTQKEFIQRTYVNKTPTESFIEGTKTAATWQTELFAASTVLPALPKPVTGGILTVAEGFSVKGAIENPTPKNIGEASIIPAFLAIGAGTKGISFVKSKVFKPGEFTVSKSSGVGIEKNIGNKITVMESYGESIGTRQPYIKVPFIDKRINLKPEQIKVFSENMIVATGEKAGGIDIFTAVSKEGKTSSGVNVIKAVKNEKLRNPLMDEDVIPSKAGIKTVTSEKSSTQFGPQYSKKVAENTINTNIIDYRDGLKVSTGTMTQKKVVGVTITPKALSTSENIIYGNFEKSGNVITKSRQSDSLLINPDTTVKASASTISKIEKTAPEVVVSPKLSKAHFSRVGTIAEKTTEPVVQIKKKEKEVETIKTGFTPITSIKEISDTKNILTPATAISMEEKITEESYPKETLFPTMSTLATTEFEITDRKEKFKFPPVVPLKTITSNITKITPPTTDKVNRIPEVPPGLNFKFGDFEKKRKKDYYYDTAWRYSEKTNPMARPKDVLPEVFGKNRKDDFKPMKIRSDFKIPKGGFKL